MLLEVEPMLDMVKIEAFWARTCETAVRLATIRAVGNSGEVTLADMQWGRAVATWSTQRMIEAADEHMAANSFQDYQNRIVRFMRRKQVPVTRRDIQNMLDGELKIKELTEVLDTMVERGRVIASIREKPKVGRPPKSPSYSLPNADTRRDLSAALL